METRVSNPSSSRAAQYVRMSTEHQQYSIDNQAAAIAQYASFHSIEIVRSYVDSGKSGLKLEGRQALQELIRTVTTRQADFGHILVYDVSRWGRFQDADESAFYEYMCKRAGIKVHYCAEPFSTDETTPTNLIKALKRTMAGEYSRELSKKVFAGQRRLAQLGFRQGGSPGYGLRRQLIDPNGNPKMLLAHGECKGIHTDRVKLVPGPEEEVAVVRRVFDLYTNEERSTGAIAHLFNNQGVKREGGHGWTKDFIRRMLSNPKYAGANLYNRNSTKLRTARTQNPPEAWVLTDGAFESIVSREQFLRARAVMQERQKRDTDQELLDSLRRLLARAGRITSRLIDQTKDMPSRSTICRRFGSLRRAWKLIGYNPLRDYAYVDANRFIRQLHSKEIEDMQFRLRKIGADVEQDPTTGFLLVNREFTVSLVITRCRTQGGSCRWWIERQRFLQPDLIIVARSGPANKSVMDYYILSSSDVAEFSGRLAFENPLHIDVHRLDSLSKFFAAARRSPVEEAYESSADSPDTNCRDQHP